MSESLASKRKPRWIWFVAVLILAIVVLYPILLRYFAGNSLDKLGYFGDIYGAVNALFSGFAFLGIVYTIHIQMQELELQRQELAETREEIRGQREQLTVQSDAWKRQNFESAFFQLLTLLSGYISSLQIVVDNQWREGRPAIQG